jgi:hypothetical protein
MSQITKINRQEIVVSGYRVIELAPYERAANRWVDLFMALVFLAGVVMIFTVGAITIAYHSGVYSEVPANVRR